MLHLILRFVSLLSFIIKKRVSDRKPFYLLKGRSVGGSVRGASVRLPVPVHKSSSGPKRDWKLPCTNDLRCVKMGQTTKIMSKNIKYIETLCLALKEKKFKKNIQIFFPLLLYSNTPFCLLRPKDKILIHIHL